MDTQTIITIEPASAVDALASAICVSPCPIFWAGLPRGNPYREILDDFPELTEDDIRAAGAYGSLS